MTELYINNRQVVLPENFGITLTRENTHVTKRGDYTLDVTLSLLDPVNASIFGHVNRQNVALSSITGTAILLCDSQEELNGSFTVTNYTNKDITLQLLADNSAFNFLLKTGLASKKIWTLDFGTETPIDYARAKASIDGTNPNEHFWCVPVLFTDKWANDYTYMDVIHETVEPLMTGCNNIVMQPKLLYILEKLFEIIGYSVAVNELRNWPRAAKMYITNPIQSLKYSDCLPDWTVDEFLTEIEKLFNVEYFIDTKKSTVSIKKRNISDKIVYLSADDTEDNYENEVSTSGDAVETDYDNVGYSFPDTNYFKYSKLSDEVKNNTILVECIPDPSMVDGYGHVTDLSVVGTYVNRLGIAANSCYLFHITTNNHYYIYNAKEYIEVDQFRNVVSNSAMSLNEFKIIPSEMITKQVNSFHNGSSQAYTPGNPSTYPTEGLKFKIASAYVSNRELSLTAAAQTITDMIEKGKIEVQRESVMSVNLFYGIQKTYYTDPLGLSNNTYFINHPMSSTDNGDCTLRLYVENSIFREGVLSNQIIDSTQTKKFNLLLKDTKDVTATYIINNKKYVCKKIEITINKGNKNPLVKGYFYPDNS